MTAMNPRSSVEIRAFGSWELWSWELSHAKREHQGKREVCKMSRPADAAFKAA